MASHLELGDRIQLAAAWLDAHPKSAVAIGLAIGAALALLLIAIV